MRMAQTVQLSVPGAGRSRARDACREYLAAQWRAHAWDPVIPLAMRGSQQLSPEVLCARLFQYATDGNKHRFSE